MQGNPTKTCLDCRQALTLDHFHLIRNKNGRSYVHSYCKPCGKRRRQRWHHTPAGQAAHGRNGLRQKFGITPEEYEAMLAAQGGVCAICGRAETRLNRRGTVRLLNIDHDHTTGKIRGLLCSSCNNGLGYFADDPARIQAAAIYLQLHSTKTDTSCPSPGPRGTCGCG